MGFFLAILPRNVLPCLCVERRMSERIERKRVNSIMSGLVTNDRLSLEKTTSAGHFRFIVSNNIK